MAAYTCDTAVVDKCYACNGIWFDDKELGVFRRCLERFDLSQLKILFHPPRPYGYQVALCPCCEEVLVEETFSYNTDVKLLRCLNCRGIWLPAHEMVGFIELAQLGQAIAPDVRGFLKEHAQLMWENRRFDSLRRLGRWLMTPADWYWS